jgi:peroxiredoxin Q/BCP
MTLEIGQQAPDFTLPDQHGNMVTLSSFRGKKNVVLIMYPGDDTPGCTKQLCSVRDNFADFEALDAEVFGINHADAGSHEKFVDKYHLKNPLLVDAGRKVIKEYGAIGNFMGHESTKRTVVIVDKAGVIVYLKQGLPSHSELKKALETANSKQ